MTPAQRAGESAGPPVNPILGAHVLAGPEDLDFVLEGPLPLRWQRSYRSTNEHAGWFGRGWSSSLEIRLQAIADQSGAYIDHVDCIDLYGRRIEFPPLAPGKSHFSKAEKMTLTRSAAGRYRIDTEDGRFYWFDDRTGADHRLAALTDRNGNAVRLEHELADGRLVSSRVTCSGGQVLVLHFDSGRLRRIVEHRGEDHLRHVTRVRYDYSARGDLQAVYNAAGECMRRFDTNADGLVERHVYAATFEAGTEYVGEGKASKVVRHWDNVGQAWVFLYGPDRTTVTDQDGRVSVHHFDAYRRRTGYTDPLGRFTRYARDLDGNLRFVIDPAERVTEMTYDEHGSPTELRDPANARTKVEWHAALRRPVLIEDALNRVTRYAYDARGNTILQVEPDGTETNYEVDERGLPVVIVDGNGGKTTLSYNRAGQVVSHTDCSKRTTLYEYDEDGFLAAMVDALGQRTTYVHDAVGRLLRVQYADGSEELFTYDLASRTLSATNALGATTSYRYAPDGLLTDVVDALGHVRSQRYSACRNVVELVNENGAIAGFAYDVLDRLIAESGFDGIRRRMAYDAADNLVATLEAPGSTEAIETRYTCDAAGRLVRRANETDTMVYVYDAAGQMEIARNKATEVRFKHDDAGRVLQESLTVLGETHVISHVYDALGNPIETVIDGTRLSTVYYGSGHAHRISLDDEPVADFERDALHRETSRTQGRLTTDRRYDMRDNLTAQQVAPLGPNAMRLDRHYTYDLANRLVETLECGGALVHSYDAIDRLTRFSDERHAFDPAHNMQPADSAAGANATVAPIMDNRVTVYGDRRYTYDVHGRVVRKTIGSHTVVELRWDEAHQLVESHVRGNAGEQRTRYVYDAFGRRVAKIGASGTTRYLWDGLKLLQETDAHERRIFVHEPNDDVPLAQVVMGTGENEQARVLYYHCDQVGLPRELTDSDGRVTWAADFHGWGALRADQGLGVPQPLRYQGQYFDRETGLHYNLSRYYDPDCGHFMSPDPVGFNGGINEYQYAVNPTGWIDLWGLTGTYIMSGGKAKNYAGKGPSERSKVSKKERLKGCSTTVMVHKDYGDNEMAFMVEHIVMEKYKAVTSGNWANAINSPGKKRMADSKISAAKKAQAQKNADDLIADFEAQKAACGL
jgi:RHS repeat-associated protein